MMTSVLRDSLGGNCKTVMIATVNAETVGGGCASVCEGGDAWGVTFKDCSAYRSKPQGVMDSSAPHPTS